jgi:hypothetical protein
VTLGKSLELPFVTQRPWRVLPDDGEPAPHEVERPATYLER